jgi:hypothetical protein
MRAGSLAAGMVIVVLGLAAAAPAQEISLSIGAGSFFPSQSAVRQVYGSGLILAGDVWIKLKGPVGFASGFGRLSDKGVAVPMGEGAEEYPLAFRRTSVPLLVFYELGSRTVDVRLAAGIGIHSFREAWQTVDLVYTAHRVSPRFTLATSIALTDRLSLFCSATYDSIPTKAGSLLSAAVNLGGFQLLGGLAFRIF